MAERKKVQFSFSGGEISPGLLGHSDLDRWQSSAEKCRNTIPLSSGGAMNRPGTEMIGYEHVRARTFSDIQVTATTAENPAQCTTAVPHGFTSGEIVTIKTDFGATAAMQGVECQVEVIDSTNFYLLNYDGTVDAASHTLDIRPLEASHEIRVVGFSLSASESFTLIFGDEYMMVSKNGSMVLESTTLTLTSWDYIAAGAGPGGSTDRRARLTTSAPHGLWSDDEIYVGEQDFTVPFPKDHGNKRYRVELEDETGTSIPIGTTPATKAKPCVITSNAAHGLSNDHKIVIRSMVGMTELNDREFTCRNITSTTIELEDEWGNEEDSTGYGTHTSLGNIRGRSVDKFRLDASGGFGPSTNATSTTLSRYYILRTPWASSDLSNLQYAPSPETGEMTLTCAGYAPRKLTRVADDNWSIVETTFVPSITPPPTITASTAGTTHLAKVTAVSKGTGEQSLAKEKYVGSHAAQELTIATVDDAFEYNVYMSTLNSNDSGFAGITDLTKLTLDTSVTEPVYDKTIRPPNPQNPFWVDGTTATITGATAAEPIVVTTSAAHGVLDGQYVRLEGVTVMPELDNKVYEAANVTAATLELRYTDGTGHAGAGTAGSVIPLAAIDYPAAVAYFQQRLWLANTPLYQKVVYASQSRSYDSMGTSTPIRDSDAISFKIVGGSDDAIRYLVPMTQLLAFTGGGVYVIVGNDHGIMTPADSYPIPLNADGAAMVQPLQVGTGVVYVTRQGPNIAELIPSGQSGSTNAFTQGEPFLSALATHLFENKEITGGAVARHPDSLLWWTRDDGLLLCLTYITSAGVVAWSPHDTQYGDFEDVATVPEGTRTGTYFSVKRTLNNVTKRYFERFDDRDFEDVEDVWFLDSALKYDDVHDVETRRDHWSALRFFMADNSPVTAGDYVDITHKVRETYGIVDGGLHRKRLYVANKFGSAGGSLQSFSLEDLDGNPYDATADLSGVDTRTLKIHICTQSVTGLDHLIGLSVGVLADGNTLAEKTVTADGTLAFDDYHSRILVGLPFISDVLTLSPDSVGGPFQSLQGARMKTQSAMMTVEDTLGVQIGTKESNLHTPKWAKTPTTYGTAPALVSGRKRVSLAKEWGDGKVLMRQADPLPMKVLSLQTQLEVED